MDCVAVSRALAVGAAAVLVTLPLWSAESRNMKLAGYHDLQARTAYQPVVQKQGDRANTDMHILELTGPARGIANRPKK